MQNPSSIAILPAKSSLALNTIEYFLFGSCYLRSHRYKYSIYLTDIYN
ncbi:MAG: hypothetical protein RM338_20880 [Nostoc sp. DedQUE12a]|nr:hypothetical protein [Nostoc sp. DedQUE12a]